MDIQSKYLIDYETYIKERPDENQPANEAQYKNLIENKDLSVYTFIMQYIFM
jgi:hypothetical protein